MDILLTGLNYRSAPLAIRDKVSFSKSEIAEALRRISAEFDEAVIISTCNRTEIYTTTDNPRHTTRQIVRFVADFHGVPVDGLGPHMYESLNRAAVAHLFRVSSGLDSLILGESQILGQVRAALTAASEAHSVKAPMSGLFHGAIRVGRKVREHTAISRNALSISYAGVRLAERVLGGLHGKRVMLIGAGEAGQLVATALRTSGADQVTVVNRTIARAEALAGEIGGKAAPFDKLSELLHTADIVIAATDAPEPVVTYDMAQASMAHREYQPIFYFDLAVPRDVESSVATLPGVSLYNVDDLSAIAEENLEDRRRAATAAEAIVDEETDRFMRWWESLDAVPIIRDLRQQAEWIREKEVLRALRMMPGLTDEQSLVLEAMSRSIVKKLLHDPTLSLKQLTDKSQLQTAKDLFCLWDNDPTQGQG